MDKALASILAWWDSAGVDVPDIKLVRSAPKKMARKIPERANAPAAFPNTPPQDETRPASSEAARSAKTLAELQNILSDFNAGDMSDHARRAVFARGNPEANIMVIGEFPSRDEDIQGKPFVGASGQLLDKIFGAIGLTEDDLYMTPTVNWAPPGNRAPNAGEVAICKPFLLRHIELFDPKFIVIVGGLPLQTLTDQTSIMKSRGQWTAINIAGKDIPALPIYHPTSLLSSPELKKDMWRDILSLREHLAV